MSQTTNDKRAHFHEKMRDVEGYFLGFVADFETVKRNEIGLYEENQQLKARILELEGRPNPKTGRPKKDPA